MTQVFKIVSAATLAMALAACGGGGGDDSPATNPSTGAAPGNYTQADVRSVASMGATSVSTGYKSIGATTYAGAFFAAHSSRFAGSEAATTMSCGSAFQQGSGTYIYDTKKSAARTGFGVGDQLNTSFNKCNLNGSNVVVTGTLSYTATQSMSALNTSDYDYAYDVTFISFNVSFRGVTMALHGTARMQSRFRLQGNNAVVVQKLSVPAGQTLQLVVGDQTIEYGPGASVSFTENSQGGSSATVSAQSEGSIKFSRAGKTASLLLAMPGPISGTADTQANFSATSGLMTVKETTLNLATSTTLIGGNASVSGDSDRNGSLDLMFDSNWSALSIP